MTFRTMWRFVIRSQFFLYKPNCLFYGRYYPTIKILLYLQVILFQQCLEWIFSKKCITVSDCGGCMIKIIKVITFKLPIFIPTQ